MKKSFLVLLSIFTTVLISCGGGNQESSSAEVEAPEASQEEEGDTKDHAYDAGNESSFEFDLIVANNIAAPIKLLTDLKKSGVTSYTDGLTNPFENANKYATSEEKALAFGVYGADLSYLSLHSQHQMMADYLITIRGLADDIGLGELFNEQAIAAFDRIKDNPDSMRMFIFGRYDEADDFLRSNDRMNIAANILTGGYIEGLFLASNQIEGDKPNEQAYNVFLNQKNGMKNLLHLYETMEKEGHTMNLKGDLESLFSQFQTIDSYENFSKENIDKLHMSIDEVRNGII